MLKILQEFIAYVLQTPSLPSLRGAARIPLALLPKHGWLRLEENADAVKVWLCSAVNNLQDFKQTLIGVCIDVFARQGVVVEEFDPSVGVVGCSLGRRGPYFGRADAIETSQRISVGDVLLIRWRPIIFLAWQVENIYLISAILPKRRFLARAVKGLSSRYSMRFGYTASVVFLGSSKLDVGVIADFITFSQAYTKHKK
jgi:hypothetical protein